MKVFRANGEHGGKTDRRGHRVASAHPIPEPEHVGRIDPELQHFCRIGRDGDEVPRNRLIVLPETGQRPGARRAGIRHVSKVVKVLAETMKRGSSGTRSGTASAKSVPSTLEMNR